MHNTDATAANEKLTIAISIIRPKYGVTLLSCRLDQLQDFPCLKIFPDNKGPGDSSFPMEGVSITSKPQGHMVIAYQHLEKWLLCGFACETVELGSFSEHWKGCRIIIVPMNRNNHGNNYHSDGSSVEY